MPLDPPPLDPSNILIDCEEYVGIELEVENIHEPLSISNYWRIDSDGSLRNYGVEFISTPMKAKHILPAMQHLTSKLYLHNKPTFTSRCSIHVHLNVQDLTWHQIYCLVLLYSIFEKHFFNVAGTKREENIFCVPLYKSTQLNCLTKLKASLTDWSKYTAFNLGPIYGSNHSGCLGTIEFRHLYGTLDSNIIMHWVNSIVKLKAACKKEKLNNLVNRILTMNSTSEYLHLYKTIFQEEAQVLQMSKLDFESCIINTKLALLVGQESTISATPGCHYYKLIETPNLTSSFISTWALHHAQTSPSLTSITV